MASETARRRARPRGWKMRTAGRLVPKQDRVSRCRRIATVCSRQTVQEFLRGPQGVARHEMTDQHHRGGPPRSGSRRLRRWEEPTTAAQTGSSTQTASAASPAATSTTTDAPGAPVSTSTYSSITDGTTEGPYYVTATAELTDGNLNYDSLPGDAIAIAGYVSGTAKATPLANAARRHLADGQQRLLAGVQRSCQWLYGRAVQPARACRHGRQRLLRVHHGLPGEHESRARHIHRPVS